MSRPAPWIVATLLASCALPASAQSARPAPSEPVSGALSAGSPIHNGRLGQVQVTPPKLAGEVRIDGVLDDEVWAAAAVLTGFSQYSPVDRRAAEDSTEVLVWYSDHAIHFGVRAWEPHGTVVATLAERDRIGGDDHVQIMLDTFNDRRRALIFAVNPLGVQSDGTFSEGGSGGGTDLNPDFLFESRGRLTDYGYELEIRIPFKSIRYQSASVQSWGLHVIRRVQHSGHEQTWTPAERGATSFLAQGGTLLDMQNLKRGLVLDVNPVMTARSVGHRPAGESWRYRSENPEFGGNVRWGVTSNLTMNATVNPDFSQVEADVGQVVYDPRNAISFPEKRPFFLEGSENFAVPNQLIYTRRIVSPAAAAKLNGKVGGMNVGVLAAVDDAGLSRSGNDRPLFNIVRLRRDLGEQSSAGILYTDYVDGSDYNRVAGVDTRLRVGGRYILSGQLATSFTSRSTETDHWRPLFDVSLLRPGRDWGFSASVGGVHPDFVTNTGFIPRPGIARANITPRVTFFPASPAIEAVSTSLILDGTWEYDRFQRGTIPNDAKLNTSTVLSFRGGWRTQVFTWLESFMYSPRQYGAYFIERRDDSGAVLDTVPYSGTHRLPNLGGFVQVNTPQFQTLSASAQVLAGRDVNFDEWSSAWVLFTTLNADWRPSEKVRVGARYVEQRFHRFSDGSLVRLRMIPRLKVEYQAARPVFFRFVGQYDATKLDDLRDDSRTGDPILLRMADGSFRRAAAQERAGFRADWLFSYQPNPGTVVFAGYGTSLNAPEFLQPRSLERTADGFFVKLSYLFRM